MLVSWFVFDAANKVDRSYLSVMVQLREISFLVRRLVFLDICVRGLNKVSKDYLIA